MKLEPEPPNHRWRLYDLNQTRHTLKDSSGRVTIRTQGTLRDNTQHLQETGHVSGGIGTGDPGSGSVEDSNTELPNKKLHDEGN